MDGFNFYYRALKKRPSCKWVNPIKLCENILNDTHRYVGLKYFSARVNDTPDDLSKSQRQDIYFRAIKTIPNSQIILGHFSRHKTWMDLVTPIERDVILPTSRETKKEVLRRIQVFKYEEKGSDVNIATELLIDAYENKYDTAVLISNDSDLIAPISYIKRKMKKKIVILNPQEGSSKQLTRFATFSKDISGENLKKSLFPKELRDDTGKFKKPNSW